MSCDMCETKRFYIMFFHMMNKTTVVVKVYKNTST